MIYDLVGGSLQDANHYMHNLITIKVASNNTCLNKTDNAV